MRMSLIWLSSEDFPLSDIYIWTHLNWIIMQNVINYTLFSFVGNKTLASFGLLLLFSLSLLFRRSFFESFIFVLVCFKTQKKKNEACQTIILLFSSQKLAKISNIRYGRNIYHTCLWQMTFKSAK